MTDIKKPAAADAAATPEPPQPGPGGPPGPEPTRHGDWQSNGKVTDL